MQLSQNREFNRTSSNMVDTGFKVLFKWLGIGVKTTANAIKAIISSIIGK